MNQRILAKFTLLLLLSLLIPASLANYPSIEEKQTNNILSSNDESSALSPELKSQVEKTLQGFIGGFVENKGQKHEATHYYTESSQMAVGFGTSELRFTILQPSPARHNPGDALAEHAVETRRTYTSFTLAFLGSNQVSPVAYEPTGVYCHYFRGSDPTKWSINSQYYTKLIYHNLYEQIDLVYEVKQAQLKYEFFVYPGGKLEDIQLHWAGPVSLELLEQGIQVDVHRDNRLACDFTSDFSFVDTFPIIYQSVTRDRPLAGSFEFLDPTTYGFSVPTYDPTRILIIDPLFLIYSTYIGGSDYDVYPEIVLDTAGNAYVTGGTWSTNFPMINANDSTHNGESDVFVCKLAANGSSLLYSTYVGGSRWDYGQGIAIDAAGNAYVTGYTYSTDFPTVNAYNATGDGSGTTEDAFVFKLSSDGSSLLYSTYVSGSNHDRGNGIAVDAAGNAYVTGYTPATDFPTTPNAYNDTHSGSDDVFVFKLSSDGSALLYSTYVGGSGRDVGSDIALDAAGNAYIAGYTGSTDFPTVNAYNATYSGGYDVFVFKLSSDGSALLYSTYVSGSLDDEGLGIAIDTVGNAYVTGWTVSPDFPTTPNAYNDTHSGSEDVFVFKLSSDGSALLYSTYVGGNSWDEGQGIAIDAMGNAYVTGWTISPDFPIINAYNATINDYEIAIVFKLAANGSSLLYSTYVGGSWPDFGHSIAIDAMGNVYITGYTFSSDFPTKNANDSTFNGGVIDVFVTKLLFDEFFPVISLISPTNSSFHQSGIIIDLDITDDSEIRHVLYNWDGGTNGTLTAPYDVMLPADEEQHVLRVYANDSIGNWASKTFVFITDDTAPTITLLGSANGTTHPSGTAIGIYIEDTSPLSQILYHWDASPNGTLMPLMNNIFLPAGDGPHVVHVYAQDQAGNWAVKIWVFITEDLSSSTSTTTVTTTSTSSSTLVTSPSFEVVGLFLALFTLVIAPVLYKRRRKP